MPIRFLIADDHEGARNAIAESIRYSSNDWVVCSEAEDGRVAVQMAVECRPDVVILDVRMPHLDGLQAAREIRALLPGAVIVFYTLLANPGLDAVARAAGFEAVVPKPDTAGLITAIRRALRRGSPGDIAASANPLTI